jgi:hypothetical protein
VLARSDARARRDDLLAGLCGQIQTLCLVGRLGQLFKPFAVDLVAFRTSEAEQQRYGCLDPDARATVTERGVIAPREEECLATSQLRSNHQLQMGKGAVIEFDLERGIAVEQLSQRDVLPCGRRLSRYEKSCAMCIVGTRAASSIMHRGA